MTTLALFGRLIARFRTNLDAAWGRRSVSYSNSLQFAFCDTDCHTSRSIVTYIKLSLLFTRVKCVIIWDRWAVWASKTRGNFDRFSDTSTPVTDRHQCRRWGRTLGQVTPRLRISAGRCVHVSRSSHLPRCSTPAGWSMCPWWRGTGRRWRGWWRWWRSRRRRDRATRVLWLRRRPSLWPRCSETKLRISMPPNLHADGHRFHSLSHLDMQRPLGSPFSTGDTPYFKKNVKIMIICDKK